MLALKRNQNSLYEDVQEYFSDKEFEQEIREYYQTEDIKWIGQKKNWNGLKSIVMERKP